MSERNKIVSNFEKELHEWDKKIDILQRKIEAGKQDVEKQFNTSLAEIKKRRDKLHDNIQKLKSSQEEIYENLKKEVEANKEDLEIEYRKTESWTK